MKKLCRLKVRKYAERSVYLNQYFASLLEATLADKIDVNELNEIILNIMHNIWSKQVCVQGFDWKSILFEQYVNMFEHIEISESIY